MCVWGGNSSFFFMFLVFVLIHANRKNMYTKKRTFFFVSFSGFKTNANKKRYIDGAHPRVKEQRGCALFKKRTKKKGGLCRFERKIIRRLRHKNIHSSTYTHAKSTFNRIQSVQKLFGKAFPPFQTKIPCPSLGI